MEGKATNLRALIKCRACNNLLDCPKVLPCCHAFCKSCIASLLDSSTTEHIFCPTCSEESVIPGRDPERLLSNSHLSQLVDVFKVESCSVCVLRGISCSASHVCLDCGDGLCEVCAAGHHASRITLSHKVVTVEQLDTGEFDAELMANIKVHCFYHKDKECAFYCRSCRQPYCSQCVMLDHRDHDLSSLADSLQSSVNEIIDKCNDQTDQLQKLYIQTRARYNEVLRRKQKAFSDVEIATEDLYQYLLSRKNEALERVEVVFADELDKCSVLMQDIDEAKSSAKALTHSLDVLSQTESGVFCFAQTLQYAIERIGDTCTRLQGRDICQTHISVEARREIFEGLSGPVFRFTESSSPNTYLETPSDSALSEHASPGISRASSRLSVSSMSERPSSTSWEKASSTSWGATSMENMHAFSSDETSFSSSNTHNTFSRMKYPLLNMRLLDPPSAGTKSNGCLPSIANTAAAANSPPSSNPHSAEQREWKNYKISLKLKYKIHAGVKRDHGTTKIQGLSFFGSNRIVLTDGVNNKVKSFLKDGTPNSASVEWSHEKGHTPSSIVTVGDNICFTVHKSVLIVSKNFQTIADVRLKPHCVFPDGKFSYPVWRFDNESFMVGNLKENKEWHIKTNGDILRILQSPAKAPVVAVGHDAGDNFLYSSWSQPGTVTVVSKKTLQRVRILQPSESLREWYPGYSGGDTQGNIFVTDTRQSRIVVFNTQGRHMLNIKSSRNILVEPRCLLIEDDDTMLLSGERDFVYVYQIIRS